jgi:hypothetical protein
MSELAMHLRRTTEKMACSAKVDMSLWNEHSNACLDSANAVERLEAERDELRELLREAREYTGYAAFYGDRIEADHSVDLCARIDSALNKGGEDE